MKAVRVRITRGAAGQNLMQYPAGYTGNEVSNSGLGGPIAYSGGIAVGGTHFLQFLALIQAADHVICSTEYLMNWWKKKVFRLQRKLSWLPVSANIEPDADQDAAALRKELFSQAGIPLNHRLLICFGTDHPSQLTGHLFSALRRSRERLGGNQVTLAFIGSEPGWLAEKLQRHGLGASDR